MQFGEGRRHMGQIWWGKDGEDKKDKKDRKGREDKENKTVECTLDVNP